MKKLFYFYYLFFIVSAVIPISVSAQELSTISKGTDKTLLDVKPDSMESSIIFRLQGVWAGPDETYYFRFRGDSVKEWESEGADSSQKPYCSYVLSKVACDSNSRADTGTTGYYLFITCTSLDNIETKCYSIISVTPSDLKIGFRGQYDESGHLRKMNGNDQ